MNGVVRIPKPGRSLLRWAGGMWVGSVLVLLIAKGSGWIHDLRWYIVVLMILPWHTVLGLGVMARFPRRAQAWWIVPLLLAAYAAGCWILCWAMFPGALGFHLLGREVVWTAIYSLPGAIVPVACYVLWPRVPEKVSAPVCSACGYDLRGSAASERCPECGKAILLGVDAPEPIIG